MPDPSEIVRVWKAARSLVQRPENDFSWSGWDDVWEAVQEIDLIIDAVESGRSLTAGAFMFLPAGPLQELSLSSGWGNEFITLADRYDAACGGAETCSCLDSPSKALELERTLGMDERFGEVTVLRCLRCRRPWLRYHYENEAFSRSGRWFLGRIEPSEVDGISADVARSFFAQMPWYFFGGSYYDGREGRTSGPLDV